MDDDPCTELRDGLDRQAAKFRLQAAAMERFYRETLERAFEVAGVPSRQAIGWREVSLPGE